MAAKESGDAEAMKSSLSEMARTLGEILKANGMIPQEWLAEDGTLKGRPTAAPR